MTISATDVKTLRERTNAPMMECKTALVETGGDMDKAIEYLRKKHSGMKLKEGRETAEGRIGIFVDSAKQVAAMVEMRCESAPVAKGEHFVKLSGQIAKQVALKEPANVEALLAQPFVDDPKKTVQELIGEVYGVIREVMKPHRFVRLTGQVGDYCHHDGSIGVLVQAEGDKQADMQMLRDVCMHVAARNPVSARISDIPADVLAKEKEIALAQAAATGKPANILDKIVEGKMKTWYAENVLLEQPFVKDDSKTVAELFKQNGLALARFVRYKVGEVT